MVVVCSVLALEVGCAKGTPSHPAAPPVVTSASSTPFSFVPTARERSEKTYRAAIGQCVPIGGLTPFPSPADCATLPDVNEQILSVEETPRCVVAGHPAAMLAQIDPADGPPFYVCQDLAVGYNSLNGDPAPESNNHGSGGSGSGGGYPVTCGDGTASDAGGIQGACSHHGGVG